MRFVSHFYVSDSKRACLQVGWLLAEAHSNVESQDPTEWGWESMNEIDIHTVIQVCDHHVHPSVNIIITTIIISHHHQDQQSSDKLAADTRMEEQRSIAQILSNCDDFRL